MKILASDFDNTLYVENAEVFKHNLEAIKKYILQGNIFVIITGRNYSSIKLKLNEYQIPYSYLICNDGTKIFNNLDYCIDTILLSKERIVATTSILQHYSYPYYLDDGYNETENINDCVKIAVHYEDFNVAQQIMTDIMKNVNVYSYISREHINIVDASVNKCNALKRLCNLEKLSISNLYVIGDDINDLEMLTAFQGAIMKEHHSKLDSLNKKEYKYLYQYIEELSKN